MIDMDTEREDVIRISKPEDLSNAVDDSDKARQMVLNDLTTVCNALGTLIHLSDANGYMDSKTASKMCIDFITSNFTEETPNNGDTNDLETESDDENNGH